MNVSLLHLTLYRRKRVRYEDVVENPLPSMKELYDFMNIPFTEEVQDRIGVHFDWEESRNQQLETYFSTFRNMSKFDPEHWRSQLDPGRVSHIDKACGHVLRTLRYSE